MMSVFDNQIKMNTVLRETQGNQTEWYVKFIVIKKFDDYYF